MMVQCITRKHFTFRESCGRHIAHAPEMVARRTEWLEARQ